MQEVIDSVSSAAVRVRTPRATELAALLRADGVTVSCPAPGTLELRGIGTEHVGEVALAHGIVLHELSARSASLEEAFMSLTQDAVEYRSDVPVPAPAASEGASR